MNTDLKKLNNPCNKCGALLNPDNIVRNRKWCKSCFYKTIKKQPITTVIPTTNESISHKTERTIICGYSGSRKTYLMNYILNKLNRDDVFIICRSKDQYPDRYFNQSTEIKPLEDYRNLTVIFDDMLCGKQSQEIDQFFTRSRYQNINIYYISQS